LIIRSVCAAHAVIVGGFVIVPDDLDLTINA